MAPTIKPKRTLTQADADFLMGIFVTKHDINGLASKKDLIDQEEKFEAKITEFKDEFYTKVDPILKEVKASQEERTIAAEQHRRNLDRIEKIEKIHPNGAHIAAI